MAALPPIDGSTVFWRLFATLGFVFLNGFFVAAEFALVKVRRARIEALAASGSSSARVVCKLLDKMDLHLSACQFGITVASLILGWLAEPAVARLLLEAASALGLAVADGPVLHAVALGIALAIVTTLHMTLGEQAPKLWAIQRPEALALRCAYPLRIFTVVFGPLIWVINRISNALLRLGGVSSHEMHEGSFTADELRGVLASSAHAGHITARQQRFAENILGFIGLEVRHIMVPRVDVVQLSTSATPEEALALIRETQHSRYPITPGSLDELTGMVHTKDVLATLAEDRPLVLEEIAREPVLLPDTQSLGKMIFELQRARAKSAMVIDDHGTVIGMAFLEDALEEIVGPIQDEFDDEEPPVSRPDANTLVLRGDLPLPDAGLLLGLEETTSDDTIGGHVVAILGRLPREGDQLTIGAYRVTVTDVGRRRIRHLRCDRTAAEDDEG